MSLFHPKTKKSQRFYWMPEEYMRLLKEHIKTNSLNENNYVFFSRKSKRDPIPEQTFRRNANKYCKIVFPSFHFHQLRKSNVTRLHDKGISLEDIKSYVGHSNSKITLDVYVQESNEKRDAILAILDQTLEEII